MGGGSVNNQILTLVRRTHALIIGNSQSNQEVHKETSTPRRSVWGFGYPCASLTHGTCVYSNIRTLQRLVIHLVARVLNRGFWFSKITRIAQYTTSITNARALDTKISNITLVNNSKLLQVTTTKRTATSTTYFLVKTQNSVQQANSLTRYNMQPIESST